MEPRRWEEIQATFDTLVELDATERSHRLATLGVSDPELRAAVESLLAADAEADSRLALFDAALIYAEAPVPDSFGLVGKIISHFHVLAPLGAGGMGIVYRAEDARLGRVVALKFLLPGYSYDSVAKARFLREARAAATLDHPNLCTIHEVGESEDGRLFLAMALYPGETLKARLARESPLVKEEAFEIGRQILDGLACAHAAGIVHRDLKPANIMVLPDGTVKVLDFGLATARDESLSTSGARLGTAPYMAPEQIRGETVDARTDLWAVGAVLYEMLTARKPFGGQDHVAVAHAILHDEVTPPSTLNPDVTEELEEIILTLLEKDPARRFTDAVAVRDAISAGREIQPTTGRRRTSSIPWKRAYRWFRRRPVMAASGTLMLAAATAAGIQIAHATARESAFPSPDRVAVLPFENLSRDTTHDALGRIAADWISQQLASTGAIKVIPSLEVIQSTPAEVPGSKPSRDAFRSLALALGAGTLIHGSYYRRGDTLAFQASVFDVERGTIEGGIQPVQGTTRDAMEVVGRLAQAVSGAVATKLNYGFDPALMRPPTFDAYRVFDDGYREMLRHNFQGALDLFLRAGSRDTTFHSALFTAAAMAINVGRWGTADSIVRVLKRLTMLPPLDRVGLDYFEARLSGDEPAALRAAREQARLAPGSMIHFTAGYEALRNNRPREALQVLSALNPDQGSMRGWASYWGIVIGARHLIGDHRQELVDARAFVARFPDFFDWVRVFEVRALAAGDSVPNIPGWLDSIPGPARRRDANRGIVLEIAGSELHAHGRHTMSADVYSQAVASYELALRGKPDDEEVAFNLARTLFALNRRDDALKHAKRLQARFPRNVNYLGLLGTIQAARGETAEAKRIATSVEAWKEPYLFGRPSYWLAAIAAHSGNLDIALVWLTRAFDQGTPLWGYPNTTDFGDTHTDVFLQPLHGHPGFERLVRPRG